MDAETPNIAPLLDEWRKLSAGDRKGIMRRLPAEQRLVLQRLTSAGSPAIAEAAPQDRRFRAYSPWLGELLEACESGPEAAVKIRPRVRSALLAVHAQLSEQSARNSAKQGLPDLVRSIWQSWKARL